MVRKIYIYGLYTDIGDIRYIGKTNKQDITKRLRQHELKSKGLKTHKDHWIQKSIREGKEIKIKEIEVVNKDNWKDREKYWIKYYREIGNLTNHADGGENGNVIKYTKSYEEVREWVQNNFPCKSKNNWYNKIKNKKLPDFIPSNPREVYLKRGWISWIDFLGTGNKYDNDVNYISYNEAKKYIKENLKNTSTKECWKNDIKNNNIPEFIPNRPERYYKNKSRGWISWGDFLGTGRVANQNKNFMKYDDAIKYVHNLKINSISEWTEYCSSGLKPENIPSNPSKNYKNNGWINWNAFLNTNKISDNKKHENYLSLNESKKYVEKHFSFLKSSVQWNKYFKKDNNYIPSFIPLNPQITYKKHNWNGWGDFLGTGNIMNKDKFFLPFNEAKSVVHKYNIKSNKEWRVFSKKEGKRLNLPSAPEKFYKNSGWVNWYDWLGK